MRHSKRLPRSMDTDTAFCKSCNVVHCAHGASMTAALLLLVREREVPSYTHIVQMPIETFTTQSTHTHCQQRWPVPAYNTYHSTNNKVAGTQTGSLLPGEPKWKHQAWTQAGVSK